MNIIKIEVSAKAVILHMMKNSNSNRVNIDTLVKFYEYLANNENRFKISTEIALLDEQNIIKAVKYNDDIFWYDGLENAVQLVEGVDLEYLTEGQTLYRIAPLMEEFMHINKNTNNTEVTNNDKVTDDKVTNIRNTTNISSEMEVIQKQIKRFSELEYNPAYNVYQNNVLYPFLGVEEEDFYNIRNTVVKMLKECYNKKADEMIKLCEELKNTV